jgi:hypothetical protein
MTSYLSKDTAIELSILTAPHVKFTTSANGQKPWIQRTCRQKYDPLRIDIAGEIFWEDSREF